MTNPYFDNQNPYLEDNPYLDDKEDKKKLSIGEKVVGGLREFVNSMTFSTLGSRASLDAAYAAALSGQDAIKAGKEANKNIRQDINQFREDAPIVSTLAGVAGGVASPLGQGLGALSIAAMPARFAPQGAAAAAGVRSAVAGGVGGAVEGAVEGLQDGNPLQQAATRGAMGAALGGALGFGVAKVAQRWAPTTARELTEAVAEDPPVPAASPKFFDQLDKIDGVKRTFAPDGSDLVRPNVQTAQSRTGRTIILKDEVDLPRPSGELVRPNTTTSRPREWNPSINRRTLLPTGEEVNFYRGEFERLNAERLRLTRQLNNEADKLKSAFSEARLAKVQGLEDQLNRLTNDINEKILPYLTESGGTQKGLKLSEAGNPRTPIRFGQNTADNFDTPATPASTDPTARFLKKSDNYGNPVQPEDVTRPGSGTGSPYPYTPPESRAATAYDAAMNPKSGMNEADLSRLTPEQRELAGMIDIDNAAARAAREKQGTTLSLWERIRARLQDSGRAVKAVDEEAYRDFGQFAKVSAMQNFAIEQGLPVRQADGNYEFRGLGLRKLFATIGGTPDDLVDMQVYAQARQAASGVETPFDAQKAATVVQQFEQSRPELKEAYENILRPMYGTMVDMMESYGLVSKAGAENMRLNKDYVSLARSVFGSQGLGMRAARKNPGSKKLVGDLYQNLDSSIRSIIRNGERNVVLSRLAEKASDDIAELIPLERNADEIAEALSKLPNDITEIQKRALVDLMSVDRVIGDDVFPVMIDGARYGLKVKDTELVKALKSGFNYETGTDNELVAGVLRGVRGGTGRITGMFSVWRDIVEAAPIATDAFEAKANGANNEYLQNLRLWRDPIKGFISLYKNTPEVQAIKANRGILDFRYASTSAELDYSDLSELAKYANTNGLRLRLMRPEKAFKELAGNLSNAVRMGAALRALDNGASVRDAAYIHNNLLGDHTKTGLWLKGVNSLTGFMNYPIQANTEFASNISNPYKFAAVAMKVGAPISVFSAINWYLTKDNETIKKMRQDPNGRRYFYMLDPMNEGEVVAWRKQFALGAVFATPIEQMLDEISDREGTEAASQIALALAEELMPNVPPGLLGGLFIENATGGRFNLYGRDVPPTNSGGRAGNLPEDMGGPSTLNASRLLAQTFGGSAGAWDNVFRTVFIGRSFNAFEKVVDENLPGPAPERFNTFTKIPGLRRANTATAGNKVERKFYDEYSEASKVFSSIQQAERDNRPDRLMELLQEHREQLPQYKKVIDYKADLDRLNQEMNAIRYNEMLTPEDRRERIDSLRQLRIRVIEAYYGNQQ